MQRIHSPPLQISNERIVKHTGMCVKIMTYAAKLAKEEKADPTNHCLYFSPHYQRIKLKEKKIRFYLFLRT